MRCFLAGLLGMAVPAMLAFLPFPVAVAEAATAKLTVSAGTVSPGDRVSVTGTGFRRSRSGRVLFRGDRVANLRTNRSGRFTSTFTVPARAAGGSAAVSASAGHRRARTTFKVRAASAPAVAPASTGTLGTAAKLAFKPPALTRPTTVAIIAGKSTYNLDPARDYILEMPGSKWVNPPGGYGLKIVGGRNVVLIGGQIDIPYWSSTSVQGQRRGMMLQDQRGTVHIEGVRISGDDLSEGIDLAQNHSATVQIQNVHVTQLTARDLSFPSGEHPDVLQTWAGPKTLRVDRLTGTTNYQGLFLSPRDTADNPGNQPYRGTDPAQQWDLRHINIHGTTDPASRYMFSVFGDTPVRQSELYGDRRRAYPPVAWNQFGHSQVDGDAADRAWYGFTDGQPAGGDFVPAPSVGAGYVSPGYLRKNR